jgi:hypothetical protein
MLNRPTRPTSREAEMALQCFGREREEVRRREEAQMHYL